MNKPTQSETTSTEERCEPLPLFPPCWIPCKGCGRFYEVDQDTAIEVIHGGTMNYCSYDCYALHS